MTLPLMYTEIADWFYLITRPTDYAEEAAFYKIVIRQFAPQAKHILELGSGGGNNASHLKTSFEMTLVDLSPAMLALSLTLNPDCEHLQGDMRTVRLGKTFDAVFVHDAVMYMTSREDLRAAMLTAYTHCKPGGVALFAPDCIRETFRPQTDHSGYDEENRALRYLEWSWDPNPDDTTYQVDFTYILHEADGSVHSLADRHIFGLFSREEWLDDLAAVGFQAHSLPFVHSEVEPGATEVFVGVKNL